jgi:hypothetical protein
LIIFFFFLVLVTLLLVKIPELLPVDPDLGCIKAG